MNCFRRFNPPGAMRLAACAATLAFSLILAACGGGGGDSSGGDDTPTAPGATPPAVTGNVNVTGGTVTAALVDGGMVAVEIPANALAADTTITVTPAAVQAGEWTRFTISPGVGSFKSAITLRVRPPPSAAGTLPVLQVPTADGPVYLRLTRQSDGTLVATLNPELLTALSANVGRPGDPVFQKGDMARRQASPSPIPTPVQGTGFLVECKQPQKVLDTYDRVINGAGSATAIDAALRTLSRVHDDCTPANGVLPADVAGVTDLMRVLASRLPGDFERALSRWEAVDYSELNSANFDQFLRGIRRLLGICAAIQVLGGPPSCLNPAPFVSQYDEVTQGFENAAAAEQSVFSLRTDYDLLSNMRVDVNLLAGPAALPPLNTAVANAAERLFNRAYQLCNHAEMRVYFEYAVQGEPSNLSDGQMLDAMALCGTSLAVTGSSAFGPINETFGVLNWTPGAVKGAGRVARHDVEVINITDTQITVDLTGLHTRCSRVIGSPASADQLVVKVGDTLITKLNPPDPLSYSGRLILNTADILAALGRPSNSTDPIELDFYRSETDTLPCTIGSGDPVPIRWDERLMYKLRLEHRVSVAGTYVGTVTFSYTDQTNSDVRTVPNSSGEQVFATSSATARMSGTAEMAATVMPGQGIAFSVIRPLIISASLNEAGVNRFAGFLRACDNITINFTETFTTDDVRLDEIRWNGNAVNGSFDVGATSAFHAIGVKRRQSTFAPLASCTPGGNADETFASSFVRSVDVVGTGTIRGGVLSGSARGVVDLTEDAGLMAGFVGGITGSGEMTISWRLTRQ